MNLSRVIRVYRYHHKIVLRDLAKQIGIGASTLMRFEHGKAIDAETFLKILSWLTGPFEETK